MLENDFFKEVKSFVFDLFKNSLDSRLVYHNYNHTLQVVEASNEMALAEKVESHDLELLLIAAWFHDTGYTKGIENHENNSKDIAGEYLSEKNISNEKIEKVNELIDATKMPQKPSNLLEEIICDADLFHLGSENFKQTTNLWQLECEQFCEITKTELEWLKINEKFLSEHKYFTNYAFEKLNEQKTLNWIRTQKDINKLKTKEEAQKLKEKNKNETLKLKKNKAISGGKGVETMFRVTLRNHIKLSDIADTKANILLSVSAIMMSIVLTVLFPKLDKADNYYLIYPTIFFMLITVVTMVFSILATRPKVTSGRFTKEDVIAKKVNLLFFGNFHKMPLNDFQDGMVEMINDSDYLYKSLMKDLYFLGIVLDKKYKLLRIAYTIFMIGIIVSILAFVISFGLMEYAKN